MAGTRLGTAYVQIIPSAQGIGEKIKEALGNETTSAGTDAGEKVGSGLVGKIKTAIAAAGIGAALKTAIGEGAALEQSLGGVETLFKNSADTVISNAKNAFQTAGMSANEYMENVTSFSASLLQGLGGDTEKAASLADRAITDMSDNANKMGTSMQDIMNAYQGFAKDNYTMLDNLKLGYGGTKEEMARLINDAGVLGDTFVTVGQKGNFDKVVTFDKIIEAIGIVQDNLGITGTTAKEAESTISGSFNTMKASAQNFAGYLVLGMDMTTPFQNLVDSVGTYLSNLLPAVGNVLSGLPDVILQGLEMAKTAIGTFFSSGQLVDGLAIVTTLSENIRTGAGQLVNSGMELLLQLAQGLVNSLPVLIEYIPQIVTNIAGIINDNAPTVLATGFEILATLAQGIIQAIPVLIANLPAILQAIVAVFSAFNWVQLGQMVVAGVRAGLPALGSALRSAGTNAINAFKSINWANAGTAVCNFIHNAISGAAGLIASALRTIGTNGMNAFRSINWAGVGRAVIGFIRTAISGAAGLIASALRTTATAGMNAFKSVNWGNVGRQVINGIISGIKGAASMLFNSLRNLAKNALDAAQNALRIKSPSRVFRDGVGQWIPKGVAVGVEKYSAYATNAVEKMSDGLMESVNVSPLQLAVKSAAESQTVTTRSVMDGASRWADNKDEKTRNGNVYITYAPVQRFDEPITLAQQEAINRRDARRIRRMMQYA